MYISLGLLWLCFKIIQGEIIRCPLGGISNNDLCSRLNKGSVFYRFYLNGFQTQILGNKDNKYDVYDKPFEQFEELSWNKALGSELNVIDPMDVMRTSKGVGDMFQRQEETITMDEYKRIYTAIIFRQSLLVDCNHVPHKEQEGPSRIKTLWNETLSVGTDTYILKFHNKLISTYKDTKNTLSREDCLVLMETYHSAASIYFFSKVYTAALYKIEDGLHFGISVRDQQFKDDTSEDSKVLNAWLWLCESVKQEILVYCVEPASRPEGISEVSTLDQTGKPIEVFYSSASVFFYRKYFLDDDIPDEHKKKALEKSAIDQFQSIKDNDIIYTKYNLMYNYLVLASFGKTKQVKLENIIKAIQLPVLTTEGRLLNYKAVLITMNMIHLCLDEYGLKATSAACKPTNELRKKNYTFREIIIPKLKNVYCGMHDTDIIMKLIYNLSTKDAIINERLLHVIVTSALDFAELDPNNDKKHIITIESAIDVLEHFVKVLVEKKEEITNNKTETADKSKSEEYISTEDVVISYPDESYTKTMVELLSNLTYSTINQKTMNVFIAYKWLAELYGILCESKEHLKKYQKRLNRYIGLAENINRNDDHLKYLKNKRDAKILLANNSWGFDDWCDGWYFGNLKTETSNITKEEKSKMLEDLNFLRNESQCPYINKIEINILLYRLYVLDSVKNDYKQLYKYLESAINEIVITSEDRTRNMEAHELFSMYLMIVNRHAIEKHTEKTMPSDEMFKGKDTTNIKDKVVNTMPSDEV